MITRGRRFDADDGATLLIVLIITTAIAVVLAVVLSLVDTNVRSTTALSNQADASYGVDGAAQVAIRQLQNNAFPGGNCTSVATETPTQLAAFNYWIPATDRSSGASIAVRCSPDPATGKHGGGDSSPGSAILTLNGGASGETGIYYNSSNNASFKVKGGIFSNSSVTLIGNKSNIENTNTTNSYTLVAGACTSTGTSLLISTPAPVCNYGSNAAYPLDGRGMDPGTINGHGTSFDAPPAPTVLGTMLPATCSAQGVYEFQPGLYTSAAALNALTSASGSCAGSVWHFNPGVYYFNFKDAGNAINRRWRISSGFLVGGKATATSPVTVAKVQAQHDAKQPFCVVPKVGDPVTPSTGVEFVFGADSHMDVTKGSGSNNADVQICAANSTSGPPMAVYGLKTTIGSGVFQVPAQSGCVTTLGYAAQGQNDGQSNPAQCPVIQTYNDPYPALTIYGTTYVPKDVIDLFLNNNTAQVFRWGLVTRSLLIGATGSADLTVNVIDVPDDAPAPFAIPSVMYVDVFVCAGQATCDTTGQLTLKAKVQVDPDTHLVSVLSWSRQN
jgi:hypothetical protein